MKELNVLSLFDGMAGGRYAFDVAGVPIRKYVAAEIDPWAIYVAHNNYHNIHHVGDVTKLDPVDFRNADIVIGGSPCQSMSIAGKQKGLTTNDGQIVNSLVKYLFLKDDLGYGYDTTSDKYFHASCLFWEYIRMYRGIKEYNPNVKFFLENVVNEEWGRIITNELGREPYRINSSVFTPQNRDRYYWTNIQYIPIIPSPRKLNSIIPDAIAGAGYRGVPQKNWVYSPENPFLHVQKLTVRKDGLANCLTASGGKLTNNYQSTDGQIKPITITQAEILQGFYPGYTEGVSEHQRFKMLGNGWTVDIIAHFFRCLKYEIEKKEGYSTIKA